VGEGGSPKKRRREVSREHRVSWVIKIQECIPFKSSREGGIRVGFLECVRKNSERLEDLYVRVKVF